MIFFWATKWGPLEISDLSMAGVDNEFHGSELPEISNFPSQNASNRNLSYENRRRSMLFLFGRGTLLFIWSRKNKNANSIPE